VGGWTVLKQGSGDLVSEFRLETVPHQPLTLGPELLAKFGYGR
jgi:hypothetical protein